jgi:hypothetical protein
MLNLARDLSMSLFYSMLRTISHYTLLKKQIEIQ